MAPKKRLGKDPFVSTTPADPQAASPSEEPKIKTTRAKKPSTPPKAVAAAPVIAALPPVEKAPAEPSVANTARDAEIESIKRELAQLQVMVQRLQQQLDMLNPWSECFFSPWQWWFSLFS